MQTSMANRRMFQPFLTFFIVKSRGCGFTHTSAQAMRPLSLGKRAVENPRARPKIWPMTANPRSLAASAILVFSTGFAASAAAQKLDKDARQWLEGVAPLILADEEKLYRSLKEPADVAEFQKIFWARRDPDLATEVNEFQRDYEARRAEADKKYAVAGKRASTTDCGKVFLMLGPPDAVKAQTESADAQLRTPEVWTYRDRPGFTFTGGSIDLLFDGECQLPKGTEFGEALARVAASKIVQSSVDYKMAGGHLTKLADLLPKGSAAVSLLREPRQDFAIVATPVMQIRGRDGATYLAGLVRGDAAGLEVQDAAGKKTLPVAVAAQLVDSSGNPVATTERDAVADVTGDNAFVVSFGIAVRPGRYTLKAAALEPRSQKGGSASTPVDVVDFGAALAVTNLLVVSDVSQGAQVDSKDALAAFVVGTTRLHPRHGNVFTRADSMQLLAIVYGAKPGASGKPSVTASFSIARDGKDKAKAPEQNHETENPIPAVGPVPLTNYEPGSYTARLKIKDNVSGEEMTRETVFEVR